LILLDLDNNRFTSLDLPSNLTSLGSLHLRANQLTNFNLPEDMKALSYLDLGENELEIVNLPAGLNRLTTLRISGNTNLTSLNLPMGMTNLNGIFLRFNGLTNLTLPPDLNQLASLDVLGNKLSGLDVPSGLTNLVGLFLSGNFLTNLTLPPDMTRVISLVLNGNPLTTLVLSEPLAATNFEVVAALRDAGASVFTYPLSVQLTKVLELPGALRFAITGPPGTYTILTSNDLLDWTEANTVNNPLGSILFTDVTAHLFPRNFYRARLQSPPHPRTAIHLVSIPANPITREALSLLLRGRP
jgi:hypothetical protein